MTERLDFAGAKGALGQQGLSDPAASMWADHLFRDKGPGDTVTAEEISNLVSKVNTARAAISAQKKKSVPLPKYSKKVEDYI